MEKHRVSFMIPSVANSDDGNYSITNRNSSSHKHKGVSLAGRFDNERFNNHLFRKIVLLKDILRDLPELEQNLINSVYSKEERDRVNLPARIITGICGALFIFAVYSSIFVIGLIIASYITSPIPIYGTLMRHYVDEDTPLDLQQIFLLPPKSDKNYLTIKGSFTVAYNLYNNTPYSGSLSLYMHASYLPQSDNVDLTTDYCFSKQSYSKLRTLSFDNFKDNKLKFTAKFDINNIPNHEESKIHLDSGNLISLSKVLHLNKYEDVNLNLPESSIYESFVTYPIAGNKIEIIPEVYQGLNEVRLSVTLDSKIPLENNKDMVKKLLSDCRNGFLTLKFTSTTQRFDTMLFSGTSLPTSFLPIRIPCSTYLKHEVIDKITVIAKDQRHLYNNQQHILRKLNVSLNI